MVSAVFLIMIASSAALTQTKPTVTSEMIVDYLRPPATLEEAVQSADAIIIASIVSAETYQPPVGGAGARLLYTVQISDVLRNHQNLGAPTAQVYRFGGDMDQGDYVIRKTERGFPRFAIGHTYIMFLVWNRMLNGFEPRFGPNGIYEVMATELWIRLATPSSRDLISGSARRR
jgi:hypothetical protein